MQNGIFFSIISLIYCWIIALLFISKEKIKSNENSLFGLLTALTICGLNLEIFIALRLGYNMFLFVDDTVVEILNRLLIVYMISWLIIMTYYVICLSVKNEKTIMVSKALLSGLFALVVVLSFTLPIDIISAEKIAYSSGEVTKMAYVICGILEAICLLSFITGVRKYKIPFSKYYPILAFVIFGFAFMLIQYAIPELTLMISIHAIVIYIMYHTIENPDVKMVDEFIRNKELVEGTIEDKSNMIFRLSEDVKEPIRKINRISLSMLDKTNDNVVKEDAKNISVLSLNTLNTIDNVLNISLIDVDQKDNDTTAYGVYELFNQIIYIAKSKIEGAENFKYSISNTMPSKLRGDSTKIKEIITSIILYTHERESKGIIDLDISSIIKNKICRTIITINHKGAYMTLQEINNRLENYVSYIETTGEGTESFRTIRQAVDSIGGTILINSDEKEGITYTIILDQVIEETKESERFKELTKYVSNKRRILIFDDNYKELDYLSKEYKSNNFGVTKTMFGKDVVERIKEGEAFDILMLDNSSKDYNAVKIVNEIGKDKLRGMKVIVLLDQNEERIKNRFLEDYPFDDYVLKSNFKEELKRIIDKY